MIVKTEAVALGSKKFGDSSRIVSLFTKEFGVLSVLAKGAYQSKSKFGASLDPLCRTQITFYKKSGKDLHTLSTSELINPFLLIRSSLDKIGSGLMILESVSNTQSENSPNSELFSLLCHALEALNQCNSNPFSIFTAFQLKLASNLGFDIDLNCEYNDNCKVFVFSIENGSFFVDDINSMKANNNGRFLFRFGSETLNYLNSINSASIDEAQKVDYTYSIMQTVVEFFIRYFSYHTDKFFTYKSFNIMKV